MGRARNYIPALKFGHKIYPEDLAGIIGLPWVGEVKYVDPINGSDTTGTGNSAMNGVATVSKAYSTTTNNNNDVVIMVPTGPGTGEAYAAAETAGITWSNNLTHLVGCSAGALLSSRARVYTATAGISPFVTFSGQGCKVKDVQFYNPATTNYIDVRVSGNRNVFENVHFAGIANATAGDNATAASLELYGAQENYFVNCTIGLDTVTRTAANANLKITLGSDTVARNIFDGCVFPMMADADAPLFIKQGDSVGMDRWNLLRGCQFINAIGSTSTQQTDAFSIHATPGGLLVLQDCLKIGATGWADNLTNLYMLATSSNGTYANGIGFAVNPGA